MSGTGEGLPKSTTVPTFFPPNPTDQANDKREFKDGYSVEELFTNHSGYTYDDLILLPGDAAITIGCWILDTSESSND